MRKEGNTEEREDKGEIGSKVCDHGCVCVYFGKKETQE